MAEWNNWRLIEKRRKEEWEKMEMKENPVILKSCYPIKMLRL